MQQCSCIQAEASNLEEIAVPAAEPVDPMAAWGKAFDTASAQLAAHTNPLELYEFSDLRGLHDINIVEHDGAIEYEEKCHELSIAALSAVKSGLGSQHANLSHCRLSRKGAHALAHALACNVKIQRLTLQSNHIDGVVSGGVLAACVEALMRQPSLLLLLLLVFTRLKSTCFCTPAFHFMRSVCSDVICHSVIASGHVPLCVCMTTHSS